MSLHLHAYIYIYIYMYRYIYEYISYVSSYVHRFMLWQISLRWNPSLPPMRRWECPEKFSSTSSTTIGWSVPGLYNLGWNSLEVSMWNQLNIFPNHLDRKSQVGPLHWIRLQQHQAFSIGWRDLWIWPYPATCHPKPPIPRMQIVLCVSVVQSACHDQPISIQWGSF